MWGIGEAYIKSVYLKLNERYNRVECMFCGIFLFIFGGFCVRIKVKLLMKWRGFYGRKVIVKEVFADDEALKEELVVEFDKSDLVPVKHIDKKYLKRIERLHKIKTDTGIELSVPADYLQDRELIEFNYNEDGRISIKLKNIGQIINKK